VVYFGSNDGKIYALNAATGAFKWSYTANGNVASSPAIADGLVFVGSDDHKLYVLNASNGDVIWSYATGDMVVSSPAVAYGVVFVGSYDHMVYAFGSSLNTPPSTSNKFPLLEFLTIIIAVVLAATVLGAVTYKRKRHAQAE
jgi:outer membrane protein assembly factor BamB